MSRRINIPRELVLFEKAVVVYVEARFEGKDPMHAPPKGVNACWVHSTDLMQVPTGGVECWVRLQCWDATHRVNDVLLWTMFCKTQSGEDHPLIHFYEEAEHELVG